MVIGAIALVPVTLLLALATRQSASESVATSGSDYTLLQMNLCLSGRAGCFPRVQYPLGVHEATEVIRANGPAAVTLNEVCEADVKELAARTGYFARFAAVSSYVLPDDCIDPGGRGVYGIAVLTKARITASVDRPFAAQERNSEQRRWLCVTTDETRVCTTHLEIRGRDRLDVANDAQCDEFARVLAEMGRDGPVITGGDVNRDDPCPAAGMWVRADGVARQAPGQQHVYATTDFEDPHTQIVPMEHTDHDTLMITSELLG
jgi:endonuclease/exonuclease/phosphatase family metal-dependent hydrolase